MFKSMDLYEVVLQDTILQRLGLSVGVIAQREDSKSLGVPIFLRGSIFFSQNFSNFKFFISRRIFTCTVLHNSFVISCRLFCVRNLYYVKILSQSKFRQYQAALINVSKHQTIQKPTSAYLSSI